MCGMTDRRRDPPYREVAIHRPWYGIDDGVPLRHGIPKKDFVKTPIRDMKAEKAVAAKSSVHLRVGNEHGSGVVVRLKKGLLFLITASHVVKTRTDVAKIQIYEDDVYHGSDRSNAKRHVVRLRVRPGGIFYSMRNHDVCAVELKVPSKTQTSQLGVTRFGMAKAQDVVQIFSHPNAAPQAFSDGHVMSVDPDGETIMHDADTLPGSSGAGMFNASWELIGVHVASNVLYKDDELYPVNDGVALQVILKGLQRRATNAFNMRRA